MLSFSNTGSDIELFHISRSIDKERENNKQNPITYFNYLNVLIPPAEHYITQLYQSQLSHDKKLENKVVILYASSGTGKTTIFGGLTNNIPGIITCYCNSIKYFNNKVAYEKNIKDIDMGISIQKLPKPDITNYINSAAVKTTEIMTSNNISIEVGQLRVEEKTIDINFLSMNQNALILSLNDRENMITTIYDTVLKSYRAKTIKEYFNGIDIKEEEIIKLLRIFNLSDIVSTDGLNTSLGINLSSLSGGQKCRFMLLVCACATQGKIAILVLDELLKGSHIESKVTIIKHLASMGFILFIVDHGITFFDIQKYFSSLNITNDGAIYDVIVDVCILKREDRQLPAEIRYYSSEVGVNGETGTVATGIKKQVTAFIENELGKNADILNALDLYNMDNTKSTSVNQSINTSHHVVSEKELSIFLNTGTVAQTESEVASKYICDVTNCYKYRNENDTNELTQILVYISKIF